MPQFPKYDTEKVLLESIWIIWETLLRKSYIYFIPVLSFTPNKDLHSHLVKIQIKVF